MVKHKGPLDREDDFNGGPVNPHWTSPESAREIERLQEENKELAGQNYEFIGALLKLDADKNCTGNCKRGDGKVSGLCWRHKLLQDTLGDELSWADLRASGGLPERTALNPEAPNEDPI